MFYDRVPIDEKFYEYFYFYIMERFLQHACQEFKLSDNEQIEMVIRRHWAMDMLIFSKWIFVGLGISGLIFSLYFFFGGNISDDSFWILIFGISIYLIIVTLSYFIQWTNSIFDIIFLTNDRLIDISQKDFFHRHIIETRLEHIQDATGEVKGFLNTLFDWGKIQIRTANDIADFSIDAVQSPQVCSRKVFDLVNKARRSEKKKEFTMMNNLENKKERNKDKEKYI